MTITFFSPVLNHHQSGLADAFYSLMGNDYRFVELTCSNESKGGREDFSSRPYLVKAWENASAFNLAMYYATSSDVCLFDGLCLPFFRERMRRSRLSFEVGERWLKKGWINMLSPALLKSMLYYHILYKNKPVYKLCASAYAAKDQYLLHSYIGRCYKWGYFPNVDCLDIDSILNAKQRSDKSPTTIMWCGRLIGWKHPELAVLMAKRLIESGLNVQLDIYGDGDCRNKIASLISTNGLSRVVELKGTCDNNIIKKAMREHDILVVTSDRNEGWGVVLGEAMSNGCAVVASNEVGAAPFLIEDGYNGFIFKSGDVQSLTSQAIKLIKDPENRLLMAKNAYRTMSSVWSPTIAAKNFVQLVYDIHNGQELSISEGPCSCASPIIR